MNEADERVVLEKAVKAFDDLIAGSGQGHVVVAGDEVYQQPPVYLSFHTIETRAAGADETTYDTVCAASGASALFAYEPNEMGPKYAHLMIGLDDRIAGALGFGYEWNGFEDAEDAWQIIKESVDAGKPVKGWHFENVLFAGYEDAPEPAERKVLALLDGPDTGAFWWTWKEFGDWVKMISDWGHKSLGRHTEWGTPEPKRDTALRVLRDLVAWSTEPPEAVRKAHPKAKFGLAGIEAYARDVGDMERCPKGYFKESAWRACHAINPQWTARNATACYLDGLADEGVLGDGAGVHVRAAAQEYHAAFAAWQEFYAQLGHKAPENAWDDPERRRIGGEAAQRWLKHEAAATEALRQALE